MRKTIFLIITLFAFSCNESPKPKFSLSGTTNGIENGTMLYLDYENNILDSAVVTDNAFEFKTKLPDTPIELWLHTNDYSNYRAFWAENNPMTFDASKTDFRNALITGSKSEELSFNLLQKTDTLPMEERQKIEMEFVKANPNSVVSASMLSLYATTWGKSKTKELYEQLSAENKKSKFGKAIQRYIRLNKDPKIGKQFPDFQSTNPNGELKKLSDVKGKVILLEFWASWCRGCRQENHNLVKTYKKFHPKGLEIFAVSLDDDKQNWLDAIPKDSLTWEHVSDLKGAGNEASLIYGINEIPANFLISEDGKIIARNLMGEQLDKKLTEVLE